MYKIFYWFQPLTSFRLFHIFTFTLLFISSYNSEFLTNIIFLLHAEYSYLLWGHILMIHYLSFCLPENSLISLLFLRNISTEYRTVGWQLYFFNNLKFYFIHFFSSIVSIAKSAVNLIVAF